jgi:hypothetical protein
MDDARRGRLARRCSAAVIAIPVVWAVIAHAVGGTPTPMAAAPQRPALAFMQHLVDLGRVTPSEEVFAHFDFTNRSDRMVTIRKLEPSCGCLQPDMKKWVYYPGESGHFLLRVQTANQEAGAKEYEVAVKYEDPQPQETKVVFRVHLPDNQVFIRPRSLIVTNLGASTPTVKDIEIIDRRPEPLSIAKVDCTRSNIVELSPVTTEIDELGHTRFRFQVTIPADLPEGHVEAMLRVYTQDPNYRVLRVPLRVHTEKPRDLIAKPRTIVDPNLQPASATEEDESEVE